MAHTRMPSDTGAAGAVEGPVWKHQRARRAAYEALRRGTPSVSVSGGAGTWVEGRAGCAASAFLGVGSVAHGPAGALGRSRLAKVGSLKFCKEGPCGEPRRGGGGDSAAGEERGSMVG